MTYDEGVAAWMRRAAEECHRLAESYTRSLALYDDDDPERRKIKWGAAAVTVAAENILAAIPAPAPWTPPEDRQDGYSCLIWVHGGWEKGTWWRAVRKWRSGGDFYDAPTHFAPLPPAPEAQP